jgi:hypothetical protein
MSRYRTKLQNIQEANIRLEKRILNEQVVDAIDTPLPGCLKHVFNIDNYQGSWCKVISDTIEKTKNTININDKVKKDCATELKVDKTKVEEFVKCILDSVNTESEDLEDHDIG